MKQPILDNRIMNGENDNEHAAVESDKLSVEEWLAIIKKAALEIDPETAEYIWEYGQTLDPYGVYDLLPEEEQIQRNHFVRSPGNDIWVSIHDLPQTVFEAWEERMKRESRHDDDRGWAAFFEMVHATDNS